MFAVLPSTRIGKRGKIGGQRKEGGEGEVLLSFYAETDYKSWKRKNFASRSQVFLHPRYLQGDKVDLHLREISRRDESIEQGETSSLFASKSKILMTRFFYRGGGVRLRFKRFRFFFEFWGRDKGRKQMTFVSRRATTTYLLPLKLGVQRDKKFVQLSHRWNFYISSFFLPSALPSPFLFQRDVFENETRRFFFYNHVRVTRINILSSRTFDIPGSALIDISIDVYVHTCTRS